MDTNNIKKILREAFISNDNDTSSKINEDKGSDLAEPASDSEHERLRDLLKNQKINHAGVIYDLWKNKDATNRSLFGKKLNRDNNDSGGKYYFTKEEMSKLMSIMMNLSSTISSSLNVGKKTFNKKK